MNFRVILYIVIIVTPQARHKVHAFMNRTIIHYREDLDLQNILDYSQKKVRRTSPFIVNYCKESRYHSVKNIGLLSIFVKVAVGFVKNVTKQMTNFSQVCWLKIYKL